MIAYFWFVWLFVRNHKWKISIADDFEDLDDPTDSDLDKLIGLLEPDDGSKKRPDADQVQIVCQVLYWECQWL